MLIHVTRFNLVQEHVIDLVSAELVKIQRMLEYRTGQQNEQFLQALKDKWITDYELTSKAVFEKIEDQNLMPVSWGDV